MNPFARKRYTIPEYRERIKQLTSNTSSDSMSDQEFYDHYSTYPNIKKELLPPPTIEGDPIRSICFIPTREPEPHSASIRELATPQREGWFTNFFESFHRQRTLDTLKWGNEVATEKASLLQKAREVETAERLHLSQMTLEELKLENQQMRYNLATQKGISPELYDSYVTSVINTQLRIIEKEATYQADTNAYLVRSQADLELFMIQHKANLELEHVRQGYQLAIEWTRKMHEIDVKTAEAEADLDRRLGELKATESLVMHQRSITSGIESQLLTELEEYRIKEYELEQRKEHRQLPAPVADAQLFTIRGIIRAKEEDLVALRRKPVSDVDG